MLKEEKLIYLLHMFAPLALLPMRNRALLLLAIPGFAFSLLTTGYDPTLSIGFQYTCHTIPYLFAATVLMLRVIGRGQDGVIKRARRARRDRHRRTEPQLRVRRGAAAQLLRRRLLQGRVHPEQRGALALRRRSRGWPR